MIHSPWLDTPPAPTAPLVVMGVAGCGKSSLAQALAARLGWPYIEGDDHHSPENKALMRAGTPLTDAHRAGWLTVLGSQLQAASGAAVLSCSALKRRYRDALRDAVPALRFVYLDISPALAQARVTARAAGHYFPPQLVASQFATLEVPTDEPDVLTLAADTPLPTLTDAVLRWLPAPLPPKPQP